MELFGLEEISELRVTRMNFILSLGAIYFSILAVLIALNLYIPWSYYFSIVFFIIIYYTHYKGREKIGHIESSSLKAFDDIYRIHFEYLSKRRRK